MAKTQKPQKKNEGHNGYIWSQRGGISGFVDQKKTNYYLTLLFPSLSMVQLSVIRNISNCTEVKELIFVQKRGDDIFGSLMKSRLRDTFIVKTGTRN